MSVVKDANGNRICPACGKILTMENAEFKPDGLVVITCSDCGMVVEEVMGRQ